LPAQIVGRQAALQRLHEAWTHALAARRQTVWVVGEAGVGKTTLIDHLTAELGPIACARGQCVEQYGASEPYLPVLDALAGLSRSDSAVAQLLRTAAPTWLLQLPWLLGESERQALRNELAGAQQERMLREFAEFVDRYTQRQPLLLVTEDLHWSDHATVRLIDHVARRRGPTRLLWLASFRLAEVIAADHPLKSLRHELRLHSLCEEIALDSFSETEVAEYIGRRFPQAGASEAFARALHDRTDGLPLFVTNVLDDLVAQGALKDGTDGISADALAASIPVPESLTGVIEKQLGRLDANQHALLEAASACGVEFRPAVLANTTELSTQQIDDICHGLARAGTWLRHLAVDTLPDGTLESHYAFRHVLYQQILYNRQGELARAKLHRRIAAALERERAAGRAVKAAELALHCERGRDLNAALRHYASAAESALAHYAPMEALHLTTHALGLLGGGDESNERLELELALLAPRAAALTRLYGVTSVEATGAFERIHALCNRLPVTVARAQQTIGLEWALFVRGEYERARALAARLFELAETHGDRALHTAACSLTGAVMVFQGDLLNSRRWLEQGIAASAGLGVELGHARAVVDTEVGMRARLSQPLAHLGLVNQAKAQIEKATRLAASLRQPYARRLVLVLAGFLQVRLQAPGKVLELADELDRLVAEHSMAQAEGPARWLRGWATAHLGDPQTGHALVMQGYEHDTRLGMQRGRSGVLGYAAEALTLAGHWSEARDQLDEALGLARRIGERIFLPDLHLLEARIARGRNDLEGARTAALASLQEARRQQALWLELEAQVALCELHGAGRADFAALEDALARLNEGLDEALPVRARSLLALWRVG
jgi:hypothetical protein